MAGKMLMAVLAVCVLAGAATAEIHVRQVTEFEMMSILMPDKQNVEMDTSDVWIGERGFAMDMSVDYAIQYHSDSRMMYFINHEDMEYTKMPFHMDSIFGQIMGPGYPYADSVLKTIMIMSGCMLEQMNISYVPTGKMMEINGMSTVQYEMTGGLPVMHMTADMWIDESKTEYYDLWMETMRSFAPQMEGVQRLAEMMYPIKGLPVKSETTIDAMGFPLTYRTEVIEYSEEPAPAGVFELPPDYLEVPFNATTDDQDDYDDYDDAYDDYEEEVAPESE